jgi:hypothetical protein
MAAIPSIQEGKQNKNQEMTDLPERPKMSDMVSVYTYGTTHIKKSTS